MFLLVSRYCAPRRVISFFAMASTDRDALVGLFRATGGARWLNNTNSDTDWELSKWHGIEVDDEGRVVSLWLANNHLKGNRNPRQVTLVRPGSPPPEEHAFPKATLSQVSSFESKSHNRCIFVFLRYARCSKRSIL